jgi:hypothetical protein
MLQWLTAMLGYCFAKTQAPVRLGGTLALPVCGDVHQLYTSP